jgi:Ser/Thr protein kinase RdoA (MazF antagonist)
MSLPSSPEIGGFDRLSPDLALEAIEEAYGLRLDGTMATYSSYVNRVYGVKTEEGEYFVAKFYRPQRWSTAAILEEHRFIADCVEAEVPVVAPLPELDGSTLPRLEFEDEAGLNSWSFALFPKRGGRAFDAEREGDWRRLGAIAGRIHAAGRKRPCPERLLLDRGLAGRWLEELEPLLHPDLRWEFSELVTSTLERIGPWIDGLSTQRIHGDLHRGNILDRPGEGLLVIDFDDCMTGPPVQDLWLLLPGRRGETESELRLLLEGYGEFATLEEGSLAAIESLRFLRMLHFLSWRSRQRLDSWFSQEFPEWGGRGFWTQEIEDFREQARWIEA